MRLNLVQKGGGGGGGGKFSTPHWIDPCKGGGGEEARNARLGGQELTLLCGFNQYTLLQNRDNTGLLGTPVYCSLKLGGEGGAVAPSALFGAIVRGFTITVCREKIIFQGGAAHTMMT